jgi:hypothetical protein
MLRSGYYSPLQALADCVSEEQLGKRQIYPNITELRQVSSKVSQGGWREGGQGAWWVRLHWVVALSVSEKRD